MNKLEQICATKREEVAARKRMRSLADLDASAREQTAPRGFRSALERAERSGFGLIAEIKKASPSKGLIRADFDVQRIAAIYRDNGASALSVLTDEAFFQGSDDNLRLAREVAQLPTLRKDFTIDEYQIFETRLLAVVLKHVVREEGITSTFARRRFPA